MKENNRDVFEFYENGAEIGRLERGLGKVEAARTKELLSRLLPKGRLNICDVGGGIGYYSDWLAGQGHQVTLIELAPSAVEYARAHQTSPYRAETGDARDLSMVETESMDAVLLMGPLYHLLEKEERLCCFKEAFRVLRPGGLLVAAGISKFSSMTWALSTYGLTNEFLDDPIYREMLRGELTIGEHHRPAEYPNFIARAYFHDPLTLGKELSEAGFGLDAVYAIEGCIWFTPKLEEKWGDPESRKILLELLRQTETEPTMLGMSPHILAAGRKP